ncbi:MAG TPA: hypothetical protein VGF73_04105, partial [Chthoniobacterales bacterium]
MAGVPFDVVERLATPRTIAAARAFLAAEKDFSATKLAVEQILASRRHNLSKEQFRAWRKAIIHGVMPEAKDPPSSAFAACWESASRFASVEASLAKALSDELESSRRALLTSAARYLPRYLVFSAGGLHDLIRTPDEVHIPPRKKALRARERHLLLYLQRVCGKNDTLSEFGPQGWGRTDSAIDSLRLHPEPGILKRETFLERWAAHGVAAAINADPETAAELSPRLHPNGRLEDGRFIFA